MQDFDGSKSQSAEQMVSERAEKPPSNRALTEKGRGSSSRELVDHPGCPKVGLGVEVRESKNRGKITSNGPPISTTAELANSRQPSVLRVLLPQEL